MYITRFITPRYIAEIPLHLALNTNQSSNQLTQCFLILYYRNNAENDRGEHKNERHKVMYILF